MGKVSFLLDTHVILWALLDAPNLSSNAKKTIIAPENTLFASSASAWEIATKYRIGKLNQAEKLVKMYTQYIEKLHCKTLTISNEHALKAGTLPGPHRDPFDRMIMAQATIENLTVITKDPIFTEYGIKTLW